MTGDASEIVEGIALDPTEPESIAAALYAIREAGHIALDYWFSPHPEWWDENPRSQAVWFSAEVGDALRVLAYSGRHSADAEPAGG